MTPKTGTIGNSIVLNPADLATQATSRRGNCPVDAGHTITLSKRCVPVAPRSMGRPQLYAV
eukprot:4411487-Pyramimonas_sp.AAC.1